MTAEQSGAASVREDLPGRIYVVFQINARGDELISWLTFWNSWQNIDMQLIRSIQTASDILF